MRVLITGILVVFGLSTPLAIGSNIALFFVLRRKGLPVGHVFSGMAGYLDMIYLRSGHSIRSRALDILVAANIVSTVLALVTGMALAFFLTAGQQR